MDVYLISLGLIYLNLREIRLIIEAIARMRSGPA